MFFLFFPRLFDSIRQKLEKSRADHEDIERFQEEEKRLSVELEKLEGEISNFYVFGADQEATETDLTALKSRVDQLVDLLRDFSSNTRARYQASQQLVPIDIDRQLTSLEFPVEGISQAMEEKQREQKRAKTMRTDYLTDVEQVQLWLQQAELKIQNRSIEPAKLMEQLRQIQSELAPMSDRLERLTRNGGMIVENTRDESEKEVLRGTMGTLTEQMNQVKSWLDERKQLIGDVLDAWQRFLALHEAVKLWIEEKRVFLVEPLKLSSLNQSRQRLHDYSVGF